MFSIKEAFGSKTAIETGCQDTILLISLVLWGGIWILKIARNIGLFVTLMEHFGGKKDFLEFCSEI